MTLNNLRHHLWAVDERRASFLRLFPIISVDRYRTADGSDKHVHLPNLGRAGSYYVRSVPPKHVPKNLPDPEDIFDILLARKSKPEEHPAKISSLFFAFAGIITHDMFRTSDANKDVAATSSYLDLSPLYGCDQDA